MTTKPPTRKELEAEREVLIDLRARHEHAAIRHLGRDLWAGDFSYEGNRDHAEHLRDGWLFGYNALTASITRVEALLSLSDADCQLIAACELLPTAPPAWHVVAALVRRTR